MIVIFNSFTIVIWTVSSFYLKENDHEKLKRWNTLKNVVLFCFKINSECPFSYRFLFPFLSISDSLSLSSRRQWHSKVHGRSLAYTRVSVHSSLITLTSRIKLTLMKDSLNRVHYSVSAVKTHETCTNPASKLSWLWFDLIVRRIARILLF